MPIGVAAKHRVIVSKPCHIGQPVALGASAALRIAAGARAVSETWSADESMLMRLLAVAIVISAYGTTISLSLLAYTGAEHEITAIT